MRIVPLTDTQPAITPEVDGETVKAGFIAHAKGLMDGPDPTPDGFAGRTLGLGGI